MPLLIKPDFLPGDDAPQWFVNHLNTPGESRYAPYGEDPNSQDTQVHYLTWNWDNHDLPVIFLLHGFCGHARWWSYLAPFFMNHYRVASIDLLGMGDSSHLPEYDDDCFARGILAVAKHQQLHDITIIGHSFGGIQSIRAMALAPERFKQGIIVDSLVHMPEEKMLRLIDKKGTHRRRSSLESCQQAFRLMPPQADSVPTLVDYIAYHSCIGDDSGWYWKFDPNIQNYGELWDINLLQQVTTPVHTIYAELSMFNDNDRPKRALEYYGNPQGLSIIPGAHHHIMIDHPLELVAEIKQCLNAVG